MSANTSYPLTLLPQLEKDFEPAVSFKFGLKPSRGTRGKQMALRVATNFGVVYDRIVEVDRRLGGGLDSFPKLFCPEHREESSSTMEGFFVEDVYLFNCYKCESAKSQAAEEVSTLTMVSDESRVERKLADLKGNAVTLHEVQNFWKHNQDGATQWFQARGLNLYEALMASTTVVRRLEEEESVFQAYAALLLGGESNLDMHQAFDRDSFLKNLTSWRATGEGFKDKILKPLNALYLGDDFHKEAYDTLVRWAKRKGMVSNGQSS